MLVTAQAHRPYELLTETVMLAVICADLVQQRYEPKDNARCLTAANRIARNWLQA